MKTVPFPLLSKRLGTKLAKTFTIDLTPAGCKTPEGNARVNKAIDKLENARTEVAQSTGAFIRENAYRIREALTDERFLNRSASFSRDEANEVLESLAKLETKCNEINDLHDEFLRALSGRAPREVLD